MTDWCEDDRFWACFERVMEARGARAELEAEMVVALLGMRPAARVLDLPCGLGRHSIALARRGFEVTGVDRTARYVEGARRRAGEAAGSIELAGGRAAFEVGDLRTCPLTGFDALVNLWTSFGFFRDAGDDVRTAGVFHRALRPGGVLLMDLMSKEVFAMRARDRDWDQLPDGTIRVMESRVTGSWDWIEARWTLVREGEVRTLDFGHRLYSFVELRGVLEEAGFESIEAFGSLAGTAYDRTAERLVVRARRGA